MQQLRGEEEVWVALDMSEVRKSFGGRMMEALMEVRTLNSEGLVPGYRTLTAFGMRPGGRRGILYHHLFSSQTEEFVSESQEIQTALTSVQEALEGRTGAVTYLLDHGFDDDEVWGWIWSKGEHLVCRIKHFERLVIPEKADGSENERSFLRKDALKCHVRTLASFCGRTRQR